MPQVKCKICNKSFYIKPSHQRYGWGKYCSRKCRDIGARKGKFVLCATCGKETWKTPKALNGSKSGKFFCSKSCQTKWRNEYFSGNRHPNWKGGFSREYREILIKSGIKPICKLCGLQDKRLLVVHHKDKNHKNHNDKNLVWLCLNCHYLVHNHNQELETKSKVNNKKK